MAAAVFLLLVATLFLCDPPLGVSSTFINENPMKLVNSDDDAFDIARVTPYDDHVTHHAALATSSSSLRSNIIKAIYQFGDSLSDTGNLIQEDPQTSCAYLPYGETFFHKPTGRSSNGLLMIDFFCMFFKLPFLDPYLKKDGNFCHGVNFAVAGASALNASALAKRGVESRFTNSSLLVQLDWFKSHFNSICSTKSECKDKLANSLIMMGEVGGNDYNWALLRGKSLSQVYEMVPEVVQVIKHAMKEVIKLGAIHMVVPGNFPNGCMSNYLATFETNDAKMYDELKCLKRYNEFAKFHNDKLQQVIGEVQTDHPNVTIMFADYFSAVKDILRHATLLGFDKEVIQKACCGTGNNEFNFDPHRKCGSKGVKSCENPNKYFNWDGSHLTQHAYQIIAKWLITRNFQPLLSMA